MFCMLVWTKKDTATAMHIGLVTTVQNGWDPVVVNVTGVVVAQTPATANIALLMRF